MEPQKSQVRPKWIFPLILTVGASLAQAQTSWRAGLGGGFGGAGIDKQVTVDDTSVVAKRSEGPLTVHLFLEKVVRSDFVLSFEHARGMRMGPFSSGVGFTSGALLWHYLSPAPDVKEADDSNSFFVRSWSPYTGLAGGIAEGAIQRDGDKVPTITSSGMFLGLRNGVDYLLTPSLGLRIEINMSSTIVQAAQSPARLGFFSLWAGLFIPAF